MNYLFFLISYVLVYVVFSCFWSGIIEKSIFINGGLYKNIKNSKKTKILEAIICISITVTLMKIFNEKLVIVGIVSAIIGSFGNALLTR